MTNVEAMKIPEGYKQTEVGVIPEDWGLVSFGRLITEMRGGANLSPSDYVQDGIAVIPKSGVTWGGVLKIKGKDKQFCKEEKRETYRANMVDESYTIIVLRDLVPSGPNIGLIVRVEEKQEYLLAQGVYGFKLKDGYSSGYISQLSNSSEYRKLMKSILVGSTQVHIRSTTLKETALPIPASLLEQTAIANALSDVDKLIAALETLIAKKSAIKTAAMQQLLTGKKRLPGFAGKSEGASGKMADNSGETQAAKPSSEFEASSNHNTDAANTNNQQTAPRPGYKHTELGEIPEDWEVVGLGELCTFENGDRSSNYPSPGSFVHSGIPFINAGHVSKGKVSKKDMNYITSEAYERLGGGKVKAGDVLFCLRGSLGKYGIVESDFGLGAIASSMVIVRPNSKKMTLEFLKSYFDSSLCETMIELWAGGAAQPNLGAQEMAKFSVLLPSEIEEQTAIANVLSDMDTELDALQQRLSKTKTIKQGMMQELLTGKTRLV